MEGTKVNIGKMIQVALRTCENEPWHEGATLLDKTGLDWQRASPGDKLASAGLLLAVTWGMHHLTPEIAARIDGVDSIKPLAGEVVLGLDKAFEPYSIVARNERVFGNVEVSFVGAKLLDRMGWLKPDP
jgi:hypothetical protein